MQDTQMLSTATEYSWPEDYDLFNSEKPYAYLAEYIQKMHAPEELEYIKERLLTLATAGESFKFNKSYQLWQSVCFFEHMFKDPNARFSAVLNMATGTGKTYTFLLTMLLCIANDRSPATSAPKYFSKCLIIVPTIALKEQAMDRWAQIIPHYTQALKLGNGSMTLLSEESQTHNANAQIMIVCQATIDRIRKKTGNSTKRSAFMQWCAHGRVMAIYDEGHLSYRSVTANFLETLGIKISLPVSATSDYSCGSITSLYDEVMRDSECVELPKLGITKAVEYNYLSKVIITNCHMPIREDDVSISPKTHDFVENKIDECLNKPHYHHAIAKLYATGKNRYNGSFFGMKTIIMCSSISTANALCQVFNGYYEDSWKTTPPFLNKGIREFAVTYHSKVANKAANLAYFQKNEARVLIGVRAAGFGIDVPDTALVIDNRPTTLISTTIQALGRGIRYDPTGRKTHADFVPIIYFPRQFRLDESPEFQNMHIGVVPGVKLRINKYQGPFSSDTICAPYTLQTGRIQGSDLIEKQISSYTSANPSTVTEDDGIFALRQIMRVLENMRTEVDQEIKGSFPKRYQVAITNGGGGAAAGQAATALAEAAVEDQQSKDVQDTYRKLSAIAKGIVQRLKIPLGSCSRSYSSSSRSGGGDDPQSSLRKVLDRLAKIIEAPSTGAGSSIHSIVASAQRLVQRYKRDKQIIFKHVNAEIERRQPATIDQLITAINDENWELISNEVRKSKQGVSLMPTAYANAVGDIREAIINMVLKSGGSIDNKGLKSIAHFISEFLEKQSPTRFALTVFQTLYWLNNANAGIFKSNLDNGIQHCAEKYSALSLLSHAKQYDAVVKMLFGKFTDSNDRATLVAHLADQGMVASVITKYQLDPDSVALCPDLSEYIMCLEAQFKANDLTEIDMLTKSYVSSESQAQLGLKFKTKDLEKVFTSCRDSNTDNHERTDQQLRAVIQSILDVSNVSDHPKLFIELLITALSMKQTTISKELITKVEDIDACNSQGISPLLAAAACGLTECTELLLERGAGVAMTANISAGISGGVIPLGTTSPLLAATINNHAESIQLILNKDPEVISQHNSAGQYASDLTNSEECLSILQQYNHAPPMQAQNIDEGGAAAPLQNAVDSNLSVLLFAIEESKRKHPDDQHASSPHLNKKSRTTPSRSPSPESSSAAP